MNGATKIIFSIVGTLLVMWMGWVSITLIQRGDIIIEVRTELASLKQQLHDQVPVLFKKVDILEVEKADKDHEH